MKVTVSLFLSLVFLLMVDARCQTLKDFNELLRDVTRVPQQEQESIIKQFVESHSIPLMEDTTVIFLIRSEVIPSILADFNGFMNKRYVSDTLLSSMTRIESSPWYFRKENFSTDAVVNYGYWVDNELITDSLNSSSRTSFGQSLSVVHMPDAVHAMESNEYELKGQLLSDSITSQIQGHARKLHIYLPPDYEGNTRLPLLYFHDGSFQVKEMYAHKIIDSLIINSIIKPVVAIFDDPVIRGKEYRADPLFIKYIDDELFTYVSANFGVHSGTDQNAVIGFSRGGMSALYLSHLTNKFSKVGVFSPAIHPKPISDFTKELESASFKPKTYFITRSTYDYIWNQDALALKAYLESKEGDLSFKDIPMGHNISSWRSLLDDILIKFYPVD